MSDGHKMTDEHAFVVMVVVITSRPEVHRGFANYHLTTVATAFLTAKMTKATIQVVD
jgi:hypothetical protein